MDVLDDDWTAVTLDRKLSAHFEHTILVTETGREVLTRAEAAGQWREIRCTGRLVEVRSAARRMLATSGTKVLSRRASKSFGGPEEGCLIAEG